eukprot:gene15056-16609_t
MSDTEYNENGQDEYETSEGDDVGIEDSPAEPPVKEKGQKGGKVDYTSHLRKTNKSSESVQKDKKPAESHPNYLEKLRKADTGIETKPMYVRLRGSHDESENRAPEKKFTAEELMDMAFKRADDADKRDPALRRGIASKPASSSAGTFQGIKIENDEKEDYRAALKQHVKVEAKAPAKLQDSKPSWANTGPKRINEAEMKARSPKDNNKNVPEWAQMNKGTKMNVVGLGSGGKTQSTTPEWANLANRTDRRRLAELEHKKNATTSDNQQPEWAGKPKDTREILRVEQKKKSVSTDDQPDYRGALRKGSSGNDPSTYYEQYTSLNGAKKEPPAMGWRLVKRPDVNGGYNNNDVSAEGDQVFNQQSQKSEDNETDKPPNGTSESHNGGSEIHNGASISEDNGKSRRRKYSDFQQQTRRKSSTTRPSLAASLPTDLKEEIEDSLLDWALEIMVDYEGCEINDLSSGWENGVAFCNIMHFYENDKVPIEKINSSTQRSNLMIAFQVASDVGINVPISVQEFMKSKVADANKVFDVLYAIYCKYNGAIVEWGTLA